MHKTVMAIHNLSETARPVMSVAYPWKVRQRYGVGKCLISHKHKKKAVFFLTCPCFQLKAGCSGLGIWCNRLSLVVKRYAMRHTGDEVVMHVSLTKEHLAMRAKSI